MEKTSLHGARIRPVNRLDEQPDGEFVLYWMTASRRTGYNHALERAVERAVELECGLLVLEALRSGYEHASDRLHRFVLDGMAENCRAAQGRSGATWYPYVERTADEGKGLLEALAARAAVVVTDDYPTFFLPSMLAAAADRLPVRLESVDANGLVPMRATEKVYPSAYTFRRYLQKVLPDALERFPEPDPIARLSGLPAPAIPDEILARWPSAEQELLDGGPDLAGIPLDRSVSPVELRGGQKAARERLETFLRRRLTIYAEERNHPDEDATSGLSPYLHFGHISVHEIFERLTAHEEWTNSLREREPSGKRQDWWGMSPSAEAFLDQVVTWRELGFNMAAHRADHREYDSLPEWARETLEEHASDERPHVYGLEELETADTHDPLWNAAQRQLLREGVIHNYLRMLWGKKILHWTEHPRDAARIMIELNDRYAVDGRDPNSYSGIFWTLGRYDRPWGPERPVFGKIRYMTSRNTQRKLRLNDYLATYGP